MEFFDSHAHYNDSKFEQDREDILKDIFKGGITKFISAGYDIESSKQAIEYTHKYNYIYTTSGISPNDVKETIEETKKEINELENMVEKEIQETTNKNQPLKIVGIGEIGLDYHWNKENKDVQKYAFVEQINLANRLNMPIIIHTREAVMDTIQILKENPVNKKGIFHCCPLNIELVKEALKLEYYISFAGPCTFKNSKNANEIINTVPLNKMLIETDSPYLAPEPVRGTRNDSRNVKYIAQKIADVKDLSLEDIAKITYENAMKIFNIQ